MDQILQEIDRERKARENEIDRERKAREQEIRRMKEKDERNEREIADLRNKLSQASLTPQVNQNVTCFYFVISLNTFPTCLLIIF